MPVINSLDNAKNGLEEALRELVNDDKYLAAQEVLTLLATLHTLTRHPQIWASALTEEEKAHLRERNGMIPAIKLIRARTQCGLKEAKQIADVFRATLPPFAEPEFKPSHLPPIEEIQRANHHALENKYPYDDE